MQVCPSGQRAGRASVRRRTRWHHQRRRTNRRPEPPALVQRRLLPLRREGAHRRALLRPSHSRRLHLPVCRRATAIAPSAGTAALDFHGLGFPTTSCASRRSVWRYAATITSSLPLVVAPTAASSARKIWWSKRHLAQVVDDFVSTWHHRSDRCAKSLFDEQELSRPILTELRRSILTDVGDAALCLKAEFLNQVMCSPTVGCSTLRR